MQPASPKPLPPDFPLGLVEFINTLSALGASAVAALGDLERATSAYAALATRYATAKAAGFTRQAAARQLQAAQTQATAACDAVERYIAEATAPAASEAASEAASDAAMHIQAALAALSAQGRWPLPAIPPLPAVLAEAVARDLDALATAVIEAADAAEARSARPNPSAHSAQGEGEPRDG